MDIHVFILLHRMWPTLKSYLSPYSLKRVRNVLSKPRLRRLQLGGWRFVFNLQTHKHILVTRRVEQGASTTTLPGSGKLHVSVLLQLLLLLVLPLRLKTKADPK